MCLIVFAYKHHPGYRLVLAANRDEFLDRPTAPLGYHYPGEQILAGKDLQGGGTWLGLRADGHLAAITNYRDRGRVMASAPSRGEIILEYLRSGLSAGQYLQELSSRADRYSGFNLLVGDGESLMHFSNINGRSTELVPGIYGLSNHLLNTPWPKVERVKTLFSQALAENETIDREAVFALLGDRDCPADELLPDTGVGLEWERLLSTIFIHSPGYGTRSSSLLTVTDAGRAELCERSYCHDGGVRPDGDRCYQTVLAQPSLSDAFGSW